MKKRLLILIFGFCTLVQANEFSNRCLQQLSLKCPGLTADRAILHCYPLKEESFSLECKNFFNELFLKHLDQFKAGLALAQSKHTGQKSVDLKGGGQIEAVDAGKNLMQKNLATGVVVINNKLGQKLSIDSKMNSPVEFGSQKVYFSVKDAISENLAAKQISKELASFLSFFVTETDPYSKKQTHYEQCLIGKQGNQIQFYAGPENYWFQCFATQKKQVAKRFWFYCNKKIYDLIYIGADASQIELVCNHQRG